MSGNYDYPPASNSTLRSSAPGRSQGTQQNRLQNLRDLILFTSERGRDRSSSETARALETLNSEIEQLQSESTQRRATYEQNRDALNRQLQQFQTEMSDSGAESNTPPSQPRERGRFPVITTNSSNVTNQASGSSLEGQGRRWIRPSETLARLRASRMNRSTTDLNELPDLEQAAARLREANAAISSVLNESISRTNSPLRLPNTGVSPWLPLPSDLDGTPRPTHSSDCPGTRWRSKRRKLNSDDNREGSAGFSYGHYGQVVAGPLKMEIASCDGGSYYDEGNGESSWPGNVLLDDTSVYCTKKSRCNMILNHRGETPFSLKRIVIRAPQKGFDAAIQEGMIFVSMTSNELLERTAQYQIHYPSRSRRCHDARRYYSNPSREYLNTYGARNPGTEPSLTSGASIGDLDAQAGDTGETTRSRRSLFNPTYAEPQFRITTEHDINSDGVSNNHDEALDELPTATEVGLLEMEDAESELFCPEDEENSDDGDTVEFNRGRLETHRRGQGQGHRSQYGLAGNRLESPSLIEPIWSSSGSGAATDLGGDLNGLSEIMKPHARFFIEREKSMVSINFDPPVSGRFILIKLWSPYSGGNIDIESIMVHGFAGTRYFPALGFR